jgi:hypothetical protein
MPFICQIRTDIPEGTLQVLDLRPNTSQRSLIYEPPGQTKYLRRLQNDTVATSGAGPIVTVAAYKGLAAYLIDNVEDTDNANAALTAAFANAIAAAIIAALDAGGPVTIAVVNAAIQASTGGTATLTGGDSTATLEGVLKILAGAEYVLPAGSQVEDGANDFDATVSGSFTGGQYRATYSHGALNISLGEGDLSVLTDATFDYAGTAGAACVVLDDDGTVL